MTVQEWVDGYGQAWRDRDADAAAALFTDDSSYLDIRPPSPTAGRPVSAAYWPKVTTTQEHPDVRMGRPVVSADNRRAAVEFWVRMVNSGAEVSVIGILFLRFAGRRSVRGAPRGVALRAG